MRLLESLRDHLDLLRSLGEVQEIDVEVDWNLEMGAIIRRSYELQAPAPLFNNIKGIERGFRVLGAPAGLSRQRGLSLVRVATALGLPPNATAQTFVGGYLGEPVEIIDCETVDLQVPATSEIVIEGTVSITESAREGPMGEYSGYLSPGGGQLNPICNVSALTFRDQPILPVVAAGEPTEENHTCWGLTLSAQILRELRQAGLPVTMCFCPFQSAGHWLVVTVHAAGIKGDGSELVHELAEILFNSRAGSFIPKVILIGDDIDPTNLDELVWAFATRNHPQHGQFLFPGEKMLPLVAFLRDDERLAARGTKVIYNCLSVADRGADQAPRRSSFRFLWPKEIQEKVVKNWNR